MPSTRQPSDRTRPAKRGNVAGWCAVAALAAVPLAIAGWAVAYSQAQGTVNGILAVGPDGSGGPRVSMTLCSGRVDQVELFDQRLHPADRSQPDKPIGIWTRTSPATTDEVLTLAEPGAAWTVELDPGPLDAGATYNVLAGSAEDDSGLSQVDFDPGRVSALPVGDVFVHEAEVVPAAGVRTRACTDG